MSKTQKIGYFISGALLISSFFVKDNKKAVNRRWWAVGIAGTIIAYNYATRKNLI